MVIFDSLRGAPQLGIVLAEVICDLFGWCVTASPNRTVILSQRTRWRENPPNCPGAQKLPPFECERINVKSLVLFVGRGILDAPYRTETMLRADEYAKLAGTDSPNIVPYWRPILAARLGSRALREEIGFVVLQLACTGLEAGYLAIWSTGGFSRQCAHWLRMTVLLMAGSE